MEFIGNSGPAPASAEENDDDVIGESNIWVAASDGDLDRIKELLRAGMIVNAQDENGYSPIHAAVSYSQVEVLEFLLANGADVNLKDNDGDTPLLSCEDPKIFSILKAAGADINARSSEGNGLFENVVEDENIVMIQFMIENGYVDQDKAAKAMAAIEAEHDFESFNEEDEEENGADCDDDRMV